MRTIVVLTSLISLCLFTSFAFAAPDLQVETPTFNFGEIYQGDKVPHVFEFTNQGEDPLIIDRVRSSCGCTAVLVSEKNIPPGGKGELKANFDSARFRGAISKPFISTATILSGQPCSSILKAMFLKLSPSNLLR